MDEIEIIFLTIISMIPVIYGCYLIGRRRGRASRSGDLKVLQNAMTCLEDRLTESTSKLSDERFIADKARALLTIMEDGKPDHILTASEICTMFSRKDKR